MHIKKVSGRPEPYSLRQLRLDNPNTSFPKVIPDDVLATHDVYPVKHVPAPETDHKTHRPVQEIAQVDGEWTQVWTTIELPADQAAENIRAHRDRLLTDTDWIVAVSYERGEPVPQAWADYRQSLRDVPDQEGFPRSVEWPTKP